ncbi:MAG: glycosyltransferase [Oscillospiraceae bacterium]|nr:glycosyltransferase [Oscillospiraceae bacterium]
MDTAVSVIVPVFNREKEIAACIESLRGQTLENIEIIIVNDGSTDNTLSAAESIDDERITVLSQANSGQGIARNTGMAAASGEYIAFVDSDDTVEKEMLEVMYKKAKTENADIVQCNISDIYPNGKKTVQLAPFDATVDITDKGEYTDKYFSTCRHSYEVCNKLFRKKMIDDSGVKFRDTRKYFSEDLLFNLEIIDHIKRISFISEPYYNYYQNESSHFHSGAERRLAAICDLFADYSANADETMKSAVSYTAAMVIIYNAGFCVDTHTLAARRTLSSRALKQYIKNALARKCKLKHRIFLTAMYLMPVNIKMNFAKRYSNRWNGE